VYQGLGTEGIAPTPEQERIFRRGRFIGDAIAKDVIATFADEGVEAVAEQEVPWPVQDPIGTGHADIYIPAEKHVIEVVSRKDGDLPAYKVLQVVGYAVNLGAERASVLSIDPSTYAEKAYPVEIETFRAQVDDIAHKVSMGVMLGAQDDQFMPERAGAHPGDFPCFWCPFRKTCWEGVELPDPDRLENPDHVRLLQRLADVEDQIPVFKNREKELTAERDEIRAALEPHIAPGREVVAGGIRIKRTPVAGRQSLNLSAAEKAGHRIPDNLQAFISEGKGYDRWTVRRLGV
jgi:hypothetical protein